VHKDVFKVTRNVADIKYQEQTPSESSCSKEHNTFIIPVIILGCCFAKTQAFIVNISSRH